MNIEIGDIVLAQNRYGKKGRYLVTKFGKQQGTFRGVFVVSTLRDSESMEEVRELENYGYVLLAHAYSDLKPDGVLKVIAKMGTDYGNQIEQLWKSIHKGKKPCQSKLNGKRSQRLEPNDPKAKAIYTHCFNVGRYTPTSRALPKQVSRICSGGMVRPK